MGSERSDGKGAVCKFPSAQNPREALQSPDITRCFRHYVTNIAPWYDLSDASATFGKTLPRMALENPLLFSAILALSAMHSTKTASPGRRGMAEFYHAFCIRLLIDLDASFGLAEREAGLASACLLRSYEILDGGYDLDGNSPRRNGDADCRWNRRGS